MGHFSTYLEYFFTSTVITLLTRGQYFVIKAAKEKSVSPKGNTLFRLGETLCFA